MSDPTDPNSVADVILDGKYRLGQLLGSGAFAWVFEATHATADGLEYAVKVLRPEHTGSADLERRFTNEIRTLAAMKSPYTVRVSDAGKTADGNPYLVMEKLVGVTLRDLVIAEGPLHPLHATRFAMDVLRALESAHQAGIVHRDLKPSNIFIVEEGHDGRAGAKVVDFGIAKILGSSFLREPEHESTVDATPCTPTYAAPEQLHQAPSPRSDLYALGHVLAFALQGEAPYAGSASFAAIAHHMSNEPVPLSAAVRESPLGDLIAKACQKSEGRRWQSAAEMIEALQPILEGLTTKSPDIKAPKIPARLNFGGSSDFTAPNTWSVMSIAEPTRSTGPEKLVSNLPPELEAAQVMVTSAPTRLSLVVLGSAVAIAVSALVIALTAIATADREALPERSVTETDTRPEAEPPSATPDPVLVAAAVRSALARVDVAVTVPPAHRWTVSARDSPATVWLETDDGASQARPLPIEAGFGPATRPVTLIVSFDHGRLRELVEEPGPIVMTDLRIDPPRDNDPPQANVGPSPGSLSIRRRP